MAKHLTKLKEGQKAPVFKGRDQDGNSISLADLKGKKVVLYFYPKDDTPGCTSEACDLRDHYADFQKKGYEVIGISADDEAKHQKFIAKYDLPFPLIADVDKEIIKSFDVWGQKKFMGKEYEGIIRTTFVIDEKGVIEKIITDVKVKEHSSQII